MQKITIDRSKFNYFYYNPKESLADGKCCYLGQFILQTKGGDFFFINDTFVTKYIDDTYGKDFHYEMNVAAIQKDEEKATKLFASIGYEVEFIGEYP